MKLPKEFEKRMKQMLKDEYGAFEKAFCEGDENSAIRINTLKKSAKEAVLQEFSLSEGVLWCKDGYYVDKSQISGNHPYHLGGLFYFQEPSAMAAAEALPIEDGDFVLDLCAAPGGKSTHIAASLCDSGLLVANEISKSRAKILSQNIERLGIKNAIVTSESPQTLSEKYPLFFDKILVDAPCSGEGMFRKEPKAIEQWSQERTKSCAQRQKNILQSAVKMLKEGGYLLYSTCTFAPCENEDICAYISSQLGLESVKIDMDMLSEGRNDWCESEALVQNAKRIFPHKQKGEGHFVALFKKSQKTDNYPKQEKKEPKRENQKEKEAIKLYREFEKENLKKKLFGEFVLFGDVLYLLPQKIDIDKINILRCGLCLGECKKNRFEPSHALALALTKEDFVRATSLDIHGEEIKKYLLGDVFLTNEKGYCAVCAGEFPIGWGKASEGIMKNKLPKGIRINAV